MILCQFMISWIIIRDWINILYLTTRLSRGQMSSRPILTDPNRQFNIFNEGCPCPLSQLIFSESCSARRRCKSHHAFDTYFRVENFQWMINARDSSQLRFASPGLKKSALTRPVFIPAHRLPSPNPTSRPGAWHAVRVRLTFASPCRLSLPTHH